MLGGVRKAVLTIWGLFLLIIVVFLIKAQPDIVSSTYQYQIPDYNEMPEMYREVLNENASDKIRYELNPNNIYINETGNYSEVILENFYYTRNFGMPVLPIKYFEIPIPSDAKTFNIDIVSPTYTEINVNKKIKPFVPRVHDFFEVFSRYENYDDYLSSPNIITVDFGYRGKQKYALVKYHPFGYDSKNNKLNITTSTILELWYSDEEYKDEKTLQAFGKVLTTQETLSDEQGPDAEWEKTFGGASSDYAFSVQQTTDGGYITVGYTESFGAGDEDVYLIKTYPNGNLEWSKTFGGASFDDAYSVQQTTDGGYIMAGYTNSFGVDYRDVYIVKTNSSGNQEWYNLFNQQGVYDAAYSVQQTSDGGYIMAGYTSSTFAPDSVDAYLIKTDPNGNLEWSRTFDGTYMEMDEAYSVQQTTDGGYIMAGCTFSYGGEETNVYLIKTNSNGHLEWEKTFGGASNDVALSVQQTTDGGYIMAGYTNSFGNSSGGYLIKTYPDGNMQWDKTFANTYLPSVWQTTDGGYIAAGYIYLAETDQIDVYLVKTDSNGNLEWSKTFGGALYDDANSVQQTTDGGYIIGGYTDSFGSGGYDVYLIKTLEKSSCSDGIKNGDETDIDCGGSCSPCSNEKSCLVNSDCQSNYCNPDNICSIPYSDLSIDSLNIFFNKLNGEINVSAIVQNRGEVSIDDIEVEFLDTYNNNLIKEATINIGSIAAGGSKTASVSWNLEENHIVYVIIDPNNKIRESDKGNNNAHKEYVGTLKYYVEADVPPSQASNEIENYIKDNIKDGVIIDDKEEADIKVLVARHNPTVVWDFALKEEEGCGFYGGTIKFQNETCDKPYCGVVCDIVKGGKKDVYIEANDVDGFIAASKAFVKEQDSFKTIENIGIFLDEKNEDAIAVYDYLHTPSNLPYYKEDSDEFREIVRNALDGEMYIEEQINTTANDVTLRLLHLKPAFSDKFIDYKDKLKMPVVLARGLWSDLYTWEDFGKELSSNEGRDTWLIEITGGPGQDCDSCPNYTFDDLTDSYVPALLNKVLSETGKSELQYVGFSNGCRATLSSLEKGSFEPSKVDTFVGVGCPGAFNGTSLFGDCLLKYGDNIKQYFASEGITHISQTEFSQRLAEESSVWSSCYLLSQLLGKGDGEISRTLSDQYLEWIKSSNDSQPGAGLNFDKFSLIYGYNGFGFNNDNDYIVPVNDEEEIYNGIIAGYKHLYGLSYRHNQLPDNKEVKKIIKEEVNKI